MNFKFFNYSFLQSTFFTLHAYFLPIHRNERVMVLGKLPYVSYKFISEMTKSHIRLKTVPIPHKFPIL
jgi:hypothetical protein